MLNSHGSKFHNRLNYQNTNVQMNDVIFLISKVDNVSHSGAVLIKLFSCSIDYEHEIYHAHKMLKCKQLLAF